MPGRRLGQPAAVFIGPERSIRHRLAGFEQGSHPGLCLGRHVPLGKPGDYAMSQTAPCPDGCCGLKDNEKGENHDHASGVAFSS